MPRIAVALLTLGIVSAAAAASADPIHINAGALVGDDFAARMIVSSPDHGCSIDAFGVQRARRSPPFARLLRSPAGSPIRPVPVFRSAPWLWRPAEWRASICSGETSGRGTCEAHSTTSAAPLFLLNPPASCSWRPAPVSCCVGGDRSSRASGCSSPETTRPSGRRGTGGVRRGAEGSPERDNSWFSRRNQIVTAPLRAAPRHALCRLAISREKSCRG